MTDCWVITDGNTGAKSQALGLVEYLGLDYEEKIFQLKTAFRLFAPYFDFDYLKYKTQNSSEFNFSYPPKLVIVCGSRARSIGVLLKRKFAEKIFTIYIQDPKFSPNYYDLIISPAHDSLRGENVINNFFALNRITPEKLENEKNKFPELFRQYKAPYNTILIGGDTKNYRMSDYAYNKLISDLKTLTNKISGSFLISISRRTPKMVIAALQELQNENIFVYDLKKEPNPFFAMLAAADRIFVTNDSVSMVSEAVATGKPVYTIMLHGHNNTKVARMFYNLISEEKIAIFDEKIPEKEITIQKNETQEISEKVKEILIDQHFFTFKDFEKNA